MLHVLFSFAHFNLFNPLIRNAFTLLTNTTTNNTTAETGLTDFTPLTEANNKIYLLKYCNDYECKYKQ